VSACPELGLFERMWLGQLSTAEMERLSEHLESCLKCQTAVQTLQGPDTFVEDLRAGAVSSKKSGNAATEDLIDRLKMLSKSAPELGATPADLRVDRPQASKGLGRIGTDRVAKLGSYELLEQLGEGGMGQVYKARHRGLDRDVALKLIRKERLANPDSLRRFRREIRAVAQLSHPNIVHAFDADEANGTHFLVMEYVAGTNLADLIKKEGPLPVSVACNYIRQAAMGLQHAHDRGLIHRDIKPGNLLVTGGSASAQTSHPNPLSSRKKEFSVVKILDLGLARLGTNELGESTVTQEGTVLGTPDFIAPEQARDTHGCDHRADLYSLGCTFYYLLTGKVPFPGGTLAQKLLQHQLDEPKPIQQLRSDVPIEVSNIIKKLMAKHPEDRYQSGASLVADLATVPTSPMQKAIEAGANLPATGDTVTNWSSIFNPPSRTVRAELRHTQPGRLISRHWLVLCVSGLTGLVLAFAVFLYGLLRDSGEPERGVKEEPIPAIAYKRNPPSKSAADDAWIKSVASLPVEKQVEAVSKMLLELNPGFDGKVTHRIDKNKVTELVVETDNILDLTPLRALPTLRSLGCSGTGPGKSRLPDGQFMVIQEGPLTRGQGVHRLADLSSLQGLKLTNFDCSYSMVADLSPLRGMRIGALVCTSSRVFELTPLKGMPLAVLYCQDTPITDLSPLKDTPIQHLHVNFTKVSDLSPLGGKKLVGLAIDGTEVSDLTPLKGMKLTALYCSSTKVADLTPLKGMQTLKTLFCTATRVSNISPLEGMALTTFSCEFTRVSDLSALKGMQLRELYITGTKVSDLSPLGGMQLHVLYCSNTQVSDLSPLRGMPLKDIKCNFEPKRDAELLRSMATLETINGQPAKKFWKEVDAK
jgi:serine/threonine-protein kinase